MKRQISLSKGMGRKTVWLSFAVMIMFAAVALTAPWISPHDPYQFDMKHTDLPPVWVQSTVIHGSSEYILGTDIYGRDILSRLIYGARTSFLLIMLAVPLAALLGTIVGLVSGYFGGWVDRIFMAITETIQSLPGIMVVVALILIFRAAFTPTWAHGLLTLVICFIAIAWVSLARLVRMGVLQVKSMLFIEAAVSLGATPWRSIFRHILPNISHLVLVWIINNIPAVILLEALLGYIGVGLTSATGGGEFTVVSWGGLFYSGRYTIASNPMLLVIPALCVLIISMSFILLADALNERFRA